MAGLSFEVLGPFQVRIGGEPIQIASYKQRSLLALLLMNANTVVSSDRLIDEIWGEQASKSRQNALWVHLSGIRKALANGDTDESSRLVTRSPGYLLRVEDDEVDALAFEKLVREGVALSATDPDAGSLVLSEALALWKGHAYQDFAYEEWAQDEVRRLEESRVAAVEARIDADIHRGMGRQLVGELEGLVRTYPLREHLTGQLMIALYRSSRQSEALRAYSVLSERLGEELGIEPSAELRAIEEAIVMGDSSLDAGGMAGAPGVGLVPGLSVRGYEIRSAIGDGALGVAYRAYQPAVGREVALKAIRPELADDPAFVKHFESEAQLVATLEHPHIVPLYDYWREPGGAYLVMRLMKSGSLADRLEQGPLEAEQVSTIATHVGSALDAAHRNGIVHGDVKPGNILLDEEGNAYLTDFSIAVENGEGPSSVDPEYSAPEVVSGDPATPASDVYSLAVVLRRALGRPSGEVSAVLDLATVEDQGRRLQDPLTLADRLADALGTETDAADLRHVPNPYKGLRAFSQADAADFFGRDRLVERLIARVGHSGGSSRFIAVVGPSGSGKSSAVKAGLIPALRAGALPGASTWFYAEMLPAPHPFDHLAETLEGVAIGRQADLLGMLVEDVSGIARAVEAVLPDDGSQLVLVIDQFEELFTQVDPEVADRFLKAMVAAVTDPRCRLRVIATLRADYYDRPLAKRHLGELLRDATEVVTPMTAEELGQAVSGPVSDTGVSFDSALTGRMIADVIDHPGGLPLLQYTLTELFDHRTASIIGMETYDELGGVAGALVNRSEGIYNSLSPEGQEAAREVFLRLVAVGELTEDTRRRVLESELTDAGSGEAVAEVLDRFGRHRLLTFDRDTVSRGPTVEIAHEALIRDWPRFRRWLQTSRADLRAVRRLEDAAQEWERSDRSDGYLLTSGRLAAAEEYVETGTVAPGREALDFVDASRDHEDAEIRTRRARRRRVLAGFGIAAVVGLVLAAVAFVSQLRAVDSEQVARGRALAASAAAVRDEDPELSLLLALSAADLVEPDVQSMTALHRAIAEQRAFMTWV
ncbi:MAG: BTAD domain-containing putative transcriptional regulator, partial [Acidimicrobiia bacterium]|nr:BTAD domain-containing putative transcriptional regulator [Acidimicrobiia bacterium]